MFRLLGLGAVAGFTWVALQGQPATLQPDIETAAQPAATMTWQVQDRFEADSPCRLALSPAPGDRTFRIETTGPCGSVAGQFGQAAIWREAARGNIVIENASGEKLAEFGPAEFDGLVSIYPRNVDLALLPSR